MIRSATMLALMSLPSTLLAEVELSFYGGLQSAPHSVATITGDDVLADTEFRAGWEGRSLDAPPYYGFRATWWQTDSFGFGVDINHAKVYADAETLATTGFERLEFSDGINILTVNAYHRWPDGYGALTPYVGAGLGVSLPHVELFDEDTRTFGYQVTGPAVAWIAGASYDLNETWSVFGEYKGTYSINEATLDTGGTLATDIVTNAINFGISYRF